MVQSNSATAKILFLFCGFAFIILPMTSIELIPNKQPSPDFLFCYIFISLIRNKKAMSVVSILLLCLITDLLWYRPLGLTTVTFILASEILRLYLRVREKMGFLEELICITGIYVTMICFQELIKFFTMIPSLAIGAIITYVSFTLLLYFVIALLIKISKTLNLL